MIRAQHLGAIAERPTVVKKQEKKVGLANLIVCAHCGIEKRIYTGKTCKACSSYFLEYGLPRPKRLIEREIVRRNKPKWCKTCGSPDVWSLQQCMACYKYSVKKGRSREPWKWDEDFKCVVCGYPKKASQRTKTGILTFRKDKCQPCYDYERKTQRRRPEHLWGKGQFGWCDCGRPANYQKDGFDLCTICAEE